MSEWRAVFFIGIISIANLEFQDIISWENWSTLISNFIPYLIVSFICRLWLEVYSCILIEPMFYRIRQYYRFGKSSFCGTVLHYNELHVFYLQLLCSCFFLWLQTVVAHNVKESSFPAQWRHSSGKALNILLPPTLQDVGPLESPKYVKNRTLFIVVHIMLVVLSCCYKFILWNCPQLLMPSKTKYIFESAHFTAPPRVQFS